MTIIELHELPESRRDELARASFEAARVWYPTWIEDVEDAREEIDEAIASEDTIALVALDGDRPIAWVAAEFQWAAVWDLHPMLVDPSSQGSGVGRLLVEELERRIAADGGMTLCLSTSDMTGATSLFGVDLYQDIPGAIASLKLHKPHAVGFWLRMGFTLTGLVPDAEAPGMPSIEFAKRLKPAT